MTQLRSIIYSYIAGYTPLNFKRKAAVYRAKINSTGTTMSKVFDRNAGKLRDKFNLQMGDIVAAEGTYIYEIWDGQKFASYDDEPSIFRVPYYPIDYWSRNPATGNIFDTRLLSDRIYPSQVSRNWYEAQIRLNSHTWYVLINQPNLDAAYNRYHSWRTNFDRDDMGVFHSLETATDMQLISKKDHHFLKGKYNKKYLIILPWDDLDGDIIEDYDENEDQ